mgnify:FL=1
MLEWIRGHETLLAWLGIVSAATLVASLLLVPIVVRRMPADWFVRTAGPWRERHPVAGVAMFVLRNLLAAVLLLAGAAMLVLPGQGVLTMLLGLSLLVFPGKRRAEAWLLRRTGAARVLQWLRRRAGRPPLELPG